MLGQLVFDKLFLKNLTHPVSTGKSANCTLHSVHYTLLLHLQRHLNLNMYTSYYSLNTVHRNPHYYTALCKCITSHSHVSIYVAVAHEISPGPDTRITKIDDRALCQTGVK